MRFASSWWVAVALGCNGSGGDPSGTTLDLTLPDDDGDTIMDHHEGDAADPWYDFDVDGTANWHDTDSDADGIADAVEAGDADLVTFPIDSDSDGAADFVDLDADGNCLDDAVEGAEDADGDDLLDFTDVDDDGDAILDRVEIGPTCAFPDSDLDGVPDHRDDDSDGDGIGDVYEGGTTAFDESPVDHDADGVPDFLDADSDADGIPDQDEAGAGPEPRDTDADGTGDYADPDSDNDGLGDDVELAGGTDPLDDDTDADGFTDGAEVAVGTDPLDDTSVIEGIYVEVPPRQDVEELFVFELAIELGDIGFLVDTTGSMQGTLDALIDEFSQLVSDIAVRIPDAAYGVATHDDYAFGDLGEDGDLPFLLRQQITGDTGRVQTVLGTVVIHDGGDTPESSVEAITQALAGGGYDQGCDGVFHSDTDIRPFLAAAGDPFGGSAAGASDPNGAGLLGGMGFRELALPILVYATDAPMRSAGSSYVTPGGCPRDAAAVDAAAAVEALGAYLIGVEVSDGDAFGPQAEMVALADATGSYADTDGDGAADDPLVFLWSGSSALFRETVVEAIDDLVTSVVFDEVTLEVVGDDQGFVIDIDPAVYVPSGAVDGEVITFTLLFRGTDAPSTEDRLHRLTLNVIGDGTVLLDTLDVFVLVPGTTL